MSASFREEDRLLEDWAAGRYGPNNGRVGSRNLRRLGKAAFQQPPDAIASCIDATTALIEPSLFYRGCCMCVWLLHSLPLIMLAEECLGFAPLSKQGLKGQRTGIWYMFVALGLIGTGCYILYKNSFSPMRSALEKTTSSGTHNRTLPFLLSAPPCRIPILRGHHDPPPWTAPSQTLPFTPCRNPVPL